MRCMLSAESCSHCSAPKEQRKSGSTLKLRTLCTHHRAQHESKNPVGPTSDSLLHPTVTLPEDLYCLWLLGSQAVKPILSWADGWLLLLHCYSLHTEKTDASPPHAHVGSRISSTHQQVKEHNSVV